ncbi:MAG: YMGG-like glycine zipper-containing protein [Gemmatimonadota bacterium]|nr:YMGG-like glycine zipper-containing protein [Gemmatimonadota bacterium]
MKALTRIAALPLVLLAFGCKGNDAKTNDALNSDLSLASQAHPVTAADSVSALERARANGTALAAAAPATVTHRTVVHHVYENSGSAASASNGTSARGSAPGTYTQRNTNRDAAIGAGAGAIIGAVTSKDKLKGGVIGGIAGGILGGVVGNNVDTKKVPRP